MKRFLTTPLLVLAAACSGGGSSTPAAPPTPVAIATQSMNQGNAGRVFFQQMQATGGRTPYSWSVSGAGDPVPPGLTLTSNGQLTGTPTQATSRTIVFVVQGSDGSLDTRSLFVEVRDIEIAGNPGGALVQGQQVSFSASGGVAGYTFALQANQSGATLSGNGDYTAGQGMGVDVVRATDSDGFYDEVAVTVGDDPFAGFKANWGSTDVWWIDWDVVYDPSPLYATDLDEVLVSLGLRDPASTGVTGTEADQLARLLLIRRALGHLSQYYGNGFDGNPQQGGLSISFVEPNGPGTGSTPPVGGVQSATPTRYSTICVRYGPSQGVVGTAWLDGGNGNVEHNCGNPSNTPLGVFGNRVLSPYLQAFNNSISSNPVGASDVDGLRSLLQGNAPAGGRQQAIFDVADGYGRTLAAVLAHEIGHSLGLNHSNPSTGPGDIMNTSLNVGQSVSYAFNAQHWSALQNSLPGPNR